MHNTLRQRGFTLIASLLLLVLMSGMAIGLMMMVDTEARVGGNNLENNLAYHDSEGAMEKMTSDLSALFQTIQAPQASDITNLNNFPPTQDPHVSYPDYTLTPATNPNGTLKSSFGQIHSGPNAGLNALIIPVTLHATAQRPLGDQVSMYRSVEVALIPVFQFGIFSDSDLGFFNSPTLHFNGRIHTNGDLYLGVSNGAEIDFHDKITAYGNVVRQQLPNGLDSTSYGNTGTVYILSASGGCNSMPPGPPGSNCKTLGMNQGSVVGGPTSAQNGSWGSISTNTFNGWILDGNYGKPGGTGVKPLTLPFTATGAQPYEIIRRPPKGEPVTSAIGSSRLANMAQIRVLLSDQPADLHLDGSPVDGQDIQLDNVGWAAAGVTVAGVAGKAYFADANIDTSHTFKNPDGTLATFDYNTDLVQPPGVGGKQWPLINGWLRVEYRDVNDNWIPVTQEWLQQGFARGLVPPNSEKGITNTVHPSAILLFQEIADRNGDGSITNGSIGGSPARYESPTISGTPYNWFPINLYDAREGEVRDVAQGNSSCTPNGVMNVVELDVNNLKKWLANSANGKNVDYQTQNGYILYFSDRRGMQYAPAEVELRGEYGFEDVINTPSGGAGTPNGALEPIPLGKSQSPEDVDDNNILDNWGVNHVGDAFGAAFAAATQYTGPGSKPNPYTRIANCFTVGRKNRVTGARHVLKLVNGTLGNVPTMPVAVNGSLGGFTVASENPVYIQGNYNTNSGDATWTNPNATDPPTGESAAAIIADAVTLLSNNWEDAGQTGTAGGSFLWPTGAWTSGGWQGRPATTTYYRVAIAAGKNINFPSPAFAQNGTLYGYGTDGGVHNFLRFLEAWDNGSTLNYKGSMVSLYYATYATGIFKCCGDAVYHPPTRNYIFDPLFTQPSHLPPGTPMFRDVDNLSYRQDFTAR